MEIQFVTWNVRTLFKAGSLKALTQQLQKYEIQITAVQETKWMGNEIWDTKTHTIFQSVKSNRKRECGVAFIVNKEMKKNIPGFTSVSERICRLRVKTRFLNLSVINVHAPTEDKDEAEKDEFYNQLERSYDSAPSNDIKMIIGDLNAKLGKEEIYKGTIGKQSLHTDSNDTGQRIIDFAMSRNIVISATCFPYKAIHKGTWRSPDGKTYNQIDHVLIDRRNASSIIDVRTC
jgi:exonuclease III